MQSLELGDFVIDSSGSVGVVQLVLERNDQCFIRWHTGHSRDYSEIELESFKIQKFDKEKLRDILNSRGAKY